ncbi:MAG: T9SS type A sorting domain-containing protein [Chitinophagales bacterium]|nr:T9SS type A sorting domain-containing protein [Chitinophagales bacterium]
MLKYIFIIFYIILFNITVLSQKEDYIWLYGDEPYDTVLPDRAADTTRGACNIDFNYDPPKLYYDPKRFLDFVSCNSSVCDNNGKILAYTNGMVIYNQYDRAIADTINYSEDWEYDNLEYNGVSIPRGILGIQYALMLPEPGKSGRYYAFYTTRDRSDIFYNNYMIRYALIEVDENDKEGKLISKDTKIIQDSLSGSITAIRHGNGRDWWLIAPRRNGVEAFVFLIDKAGVHYHTKYDTGFDPLLPAGGIGQVYGSPDGNWVSWFVGGELTAVGSRLVLTKFDRCSGQLFDPDMITVDSYYRFGIGTSFSHNSRFLYMCNMDYIYQYDLLDALPLKTEKRVATFDGFLYFFPYDTLRTFGRDVNFCYMGLAPDGRIYVSPSSASTRMMSKIEYPDEAGEACEVLQHSVFMPTTISRGIPNFPHYRLGPLDGSPCDTLGLDNHPVAKYRYEADMYNHLRLRFTDLSYFRPETWSWDFGDGSPHVSTQSPYHAFPKNGTYQVCLTVSNENSSNTVCRTITIGTSSSDDEPISSADVAIFPNPVQDHLVLTLSEYIPAHGLLYIYDITGRPVITQRIYYGQNNVDMSGLQAGMYVWQVMDGSHKVREGKVVKM